MKLLKNGQELDTSREHEMMSTSEFGFDVVVEYTPENWLKGRTDHFHNVTEVHHLYESHNDKRIAFKSDIHRTEFTRDVDEIISVTITNAVGLHEEC